MIIRFWFIILFLIMWVVVEAKNYDTTILGSRFTMEVKDEHNLKIIWRGITKNIQFDIYQELETDDLRNKVNFFIAFESDGLKRLNSNIFALNQNNIFLAIGGKNSTINLLGLNLKGDSISIYKNMIRYDFSPLLINSPSIVIKKIGSKSYQFIAGHKVDIYEFNDTSQFYYSNVDVITSYCCGSFFEEMQFPIILKKEKQIDVYNDDIKYYKYILSLKEIVNPLLLFKLNNPTN